MNDASAIELLGVEKIIGIGEVGMGESSEKDEAFFEFLTGSAVHVGDTISFKFATPRGKREWRVTKRVGPFIKFEALERTGWWNGKWWFLPTGIIAKVIDCPHRERD